MTNTHKHYEAARRAYYNISFSPEKRAESECAYFDEVIAEFTALFGEDKEGLKRATDRFENKFRAALHAKSRCLSSMITGPAKFPTARAERANNAEHKRTGEMLEYVEKVRESFARKERGAHIISSDDPEAIEKLETKVALLKNNQEIMKLVNKTVRKEKGETDPKKIVDAIQHLTTKERAEKIAAGALKPDCFGHYGCAPFELSNNLANIKRLESRLKQLKNRPSESAEIEREGVKIVENVEANRLQLIFNDKPSEEIRALLKSKGFRWSPRYSAWQRQLTENAKYSTQMVLRKLEEMRAA